MSTTILALITLATPAPSIGVIDLGTEVGITINGVGVSDGRLSVEKDRIEIALAEAIAPGTLEVTDKVVKKLDILRDPPRLSIQTRYGPRSTTRLARGGLLETIEGGVRVRLSRSVDQADVARGANIPQGTLFATMLLTSARPAIGGTTAQAEAPPTAAAPAATAALPAAAAPPAGAPARTTAATPAATGAAAAVGPAIAGGNAASTREPAAAPLTGTAPAVSPASVTATLGTKDDHDVSRALTWVTILGLIAAAVVLIRTAQKRRIAPESNELSILSSKALSPKVRVVLIGVSGRQLLLSVADKGAELLTEITPEDSPALAPAKRTIARAASNFARIAEEEEAAALARTSAAPRGPSIVPEAKQPTITRDLPRVPAPEASPAISGLLALRARATGADEIPRGAAWTQRTAR